VADYISLYLLLDDDNVAETTVKVQFDFSFVDKAEKQLPSNIHEIEVTNFSKESLSRGYDDFMKRDKLEKSAHLKDDSLTIKCDIVVSKDVDVDRTGANTAPFVVVPASDMNQQSTSVYRGVRCDLRDQRRDLCCTPVHTRLQVDGLQGAASWLHE